MTMFSNLKGDISGGISAAVIALPLALAFGVSAFASMGTPEALAQGAAAGMYGAIFTGIFAALFGGTPSQITGPTGPMTVVITEFIATLMKHPAILEQPDPLSAVLTLTAVIVFLGGIVQVLMGILRCGTLIKFIPYPVIAGFMNGIAVIIFLGQVAPILGIKGFFNTEGGFSPVLLNDMVGSLPVLGIGVATILAIMIAGKITQKIPASLVGLILGTGLYLLLGKTLVPEFLRFESNPFIIGAIPTGFPIPFGFLSISFGDIFAIILKYPTAFLAPALTLGILGAIDSLLTSLVADVSTKTKHHSNRELFGQGIGNAVSAVFGGMAGAGATVRTVVNIQNGGRTRISGILHGLVLLFILVALGSVAGWIPMCVLAAILIVTAISMLDTYSLSLVRKKTAFKDLLVVGVVTVITVVLDLMIAVGIGLLISAFLFLREIIGARVYKKKYRCEDILSKRARTEEETTVLSKHGCKILVYELSGNLFFGTADKLSDDVQKELDGTQIIIFDLKRVDTIDITGAELIKRICDDVKSNAETFMLSSLLSGTRSREKLMLYLRDLGVMESVGEENIFPDVDRALEAAENRMIEKYSPEAVASRCQWDFSDFALLNHLTPEQKARVKQVMEKRAYRAGETIFEEGEPGDALFFIACGYVSILAASGPKKDMRFASLGPGLYFGEMALLERSVRSARAVADEDCELYVLKMDDFENLMEEDATIGTRIFATMAKVLSQRLRKVSGELTALESV
ncbi:MAG: SLC26A/SulP transporter family protein [Deltaproteobacteria bacterium]|jgi:sulfate permease, SulP family|nr:SLC26A/SulP transporter family protein [Deltaproteobacteria bacterium]